jgi:hypothetical protein
MTDEPMFYNTHPYSPNEDHPNECQYDVGYAGKCGSKRENEVHETV